MIRWLRQYKLIPILIALAVIVGVIKYMETHHGLAR